MTQSENERVLALQREEPFIREHERIHLLLIDDACRGLADIAAGRTFEADGAIKRLQQARGKAVPGVVAER